MKILALNIWSFAFAQQPYINGPGTVQPGQAYTYTIENLGHIPFQARWEVVNGVKSGGTTSVTVAWNQGASWGTLAFYEFGSSSPVAQLGVTIVPPIPRPSEPTVSNSSRCGIGSVTLQVSGGGPNVTSYRWYDVLSGGTPIKTGTTYTTPAYTESTRTFYVSAYNSAGEGPRASVQAIIIPEPIQYAVIGGGFYCSGQSSNVSIGLPGSETGVSYTLLRGSQQVSAKPGTGNSLYWPGMPAGTYQIRASRSGCTRMMAGSRSIFIEPRPSSPSLERVNFSGCEDQSFVLSIADVPPLIPPMKYTWYDQSGNIVQENISTLFNTGPLPIGNYTYQVEFTNSEGCVSIPTSINISVNGRDTPGTISSGQIICLNTTPNTISSVASASTNAYQWQISTDNINWEDILLQGSGESYSPPGSLAQTTYYRRKLISDCVNNPYSNVSTVEVITLEQRTITGQGAYEYGQTGGYVALSNAQHNISYQLVKDGTDVGAPLVGTGSDLLWPGLYEPGLYTVKASLGTTCELDINGQVTVSIYLNPIITAPTNRLVLGQEGVVLSTTSYSSYQWKRDGVEIPGATNIDFLAKTPGNYSVVVTQVGVNGTFESEVFTLLEGLQSQGQNSIAVTRVFKENQESKNDLYLLRVGEFQREIDYFDGIGRLKQKVIQAGTHNARDFVNLFVYDQFGRQNISYLGYGSTDDNGTYKNNAIDKQLEFYSGNHNYASSNYPFARSKFENSPLDRVLEQGAPGDSWQLGASTAKFSYHLNEDSDNILTWIIDPVTGELQNEGYYTSGELTKTITTDEEGHISKEFVDKQGQTIVKRIQAVENPNLTTYVLEEWADTYYIYDDFGDLRYVLPPEAVKEIGLPSTFPYVANTSLLANWAFQYKYDGRHRMIEKKVPGARWVYMVYDSRDRLVLTQDGNQRDKKEWLFTKYDALNRPILTGIHDTTVALNQEAMQAVVDAHYDRATPSFYETLAGSIYGYTNQSYPVQEDADRYLSVTYYDDYGFQTIAPGFGTGFDYQKPGVVPSCQPVLQGTYCYEEEAFDRVTGQVTGTKTRVLDTDRWINTVLHYDNRYRVIQTVSHNEYQEVSTHVSQLYNFPGWLLATYKEQTRGSTTLGLSRRYTYDHTGRLLQGYHELYEAGVGQGEVLLAENRYNELGELIEKNLHVEGGVPHQSMDYRYNIRGWLESINNAQLNINARNDDTNDLFGMELIYQDPLNGVTSGTND